MAHSSDPEAIFTEAYDEYADAIFRHCYFRLLNRERAKELMQDAFLKTWEYLKGGHDIENIRAFLYKVANNLIIDHVRKKKEMSLDALMEQGFDPGVDGAHDMAVRVDEWKILETMSQLEPTQRDVLIMRHIDGLQPAEIAAITGESANVISVRIHRATEKLRIHLKHGEGS